MISPLPSSKRYEDLAANLATVRPIVDATLKLQKFILLHSSSPVRNMQLKGRTIDLTNIEDLSKKTFLNLIQSTFPKPYYIIMDDNNPLCDARQFQARHGNLLWACSSTRLYEIESQKPQVFEEVMADDRLGMIPFFYQDQLIKSGLENPGALLYVGLYGDIHNQWNFEPFYKAVKQGCVLAKEYLISFNGGKLPASTIIKTEEKASVRYPSEKILSDFFELYVAMHELKEEFELLQQGKAKMTACDIEYSELPHQLFATVSCRLQAGSIEHVITRKCRLRTHSGISKEKALMELQCVMLPLQASLNEKHPYHKLFSGLNFVYMCVNNNHSVHYLTSTNKNEVIELAEEDVNNVVKVLIYTKTSGRLVFDNPFQVKGERCTIS